MLVEKAQAVSGVHSAFPSHVSLPGGRLLVVYRESRTEQPVHLDGVIRMVSTADGGQSWSEPVTIFADALDLRDPNVSRIDGRLYLTCFKHNGVQPVGVFMSTSDDDGVTWTPLVRIDCEANERAAVSAPLVKAGGYFYVPWYGKKSLAESYDSAFVLRSADGITWSQHVLAQGTSRDYQEPNVTPVDGGLVAMFRHGNTDGLGRSFSVDGETWEAPAKVVSDASGKAALLRLPDRLLMVYRRVSDGKPIVRTSLDAGVSWGSQTVLDYGPALTMAYASLSVCSPGLVAVTYSLEQSMGSATVDGDARVYIRYLAIAPRHAPAGAPLPIGDMFAPRAPIVWDDFERPSPASGIGVSNSGHRWATNGMGLTVGAMYTVSLGLCLATLDSGASNVCVRGRFTFGGGGGAGLVLRAASESTYLLFVHDGDGRYARLYKSVNGAVTLLAAAADDTRNAVTTYAPYELAVKAEGNMIRCYVDEHEVLAHVLSTTDAAPYAGRTRHGVRMNRVSNSHMVHEFTVT